MILIKGFVFFIAFWTSILWIQDMIESYVKKKDSSEWISIILMIAWSTFYLINLI
jgi:hypothetical protein